MKTWAVPLLILLVTPLVAQEKGREVGFGKALPLSSKPQRLISELKGKPLITVADYMVDGKRQRVFRYSWKGNPEEFISNLRKQYHGKDGWKLTSEGKNTWDLWRLSKNGNVIFENYLIQGAKLWRDPSGPGGMRGQGNRPGHPRWIWVSYNERYAK